MKINPRRLVRTFLDLVRCDSESGHERRLAERLIPRLRRLGGTVTMDRAGDAFGGDCGNLVARFPGDPRRRPLLLCAHLDTMVPGRGIRPVVRRGFIRSAGDTILGADDKAGLAVILELLAVLPPSARPPLEVVLTVAEEKGLLGAKQMRLTKLRARHGLVLDAGGPVGQAVVAAPSHAHYRIEYLGRAAHAGIEPERGRNAIRALAAVAARLPQGRLDAVTTANVGKIGGGVARNMVAPSAWVEGEVRSHREATLARRLASVRALARATAARTGMKMKWTVTRQYIRFRIPAASPVLATLARVTGRPAATQVSNGGYDANIFNARGFEAVPVSIGFENAHSTRERIRVATLVRGARLIAAFVEAWQ